MLHGREDDEGRLHWPVDFVYLLNSRDVGATVQDVGEAGSIGLRREKATVRMGSLGGAAKTSRSSLLMLSDFLS